MTENLMTQVELHECVPYETECVRRDVYSLVETVEVRTGWYDPGVVIVPEPVEFRIVLQDTTITGTLSALGRVESVHNGDELSDFCNFILDMR